MTIPFAYKGEAMLVRWSETPKGRTVTLLLDPLVGDQHPFKFLKCGENGQRMQIAAALIGDDEKPAVPPTKRNGPAPSTVELSRSSQSEFGPHADKAEGQDKPRTPFDNLPKSQQAGIKCGDDEFDAWLRRLDGDVASEDTTTLLYYHLGITSRKDLDNDAAAAERWDRMLTSFEMRSHAR